jgi:protein-disulfide isomerase
VNDDLRAGAQAGVSGTPATFVNGRFLNGAVPYEDMAQMIREELARAGTRTPSSR